MKKYAILAICAAICATLSACAGLESVYNRDPFTGGVNAGISQSLHCPLPAGMQYYPSHSYSEGESGSLETYRGTMEPAAAALTMHNTLKNDGWQLRLSLRSSNRQLYIYSKGDRLAAILFRKQGVMTIMEIWTGTSLPDGAALAPRPLPENEGMNSIEGEEYGSIEEIPARKEETWGGEERDL